MSEADLKRAALRNKFKKTEPINTTVSSLEEEKNRKKNEAISTISRIIIDFYNPKNKRKSISTYNLKQIIKLSNKNKLLLTSDVFRCLNESENRNNVALVISDFSQRIEDFFNSQKLLPPASEPLYKINLMNLCVKVKQRILRFNNNLFKTKDPNNQLFNDMECFFGACCLYIWHVKINECAPLNNLNLTLPDKDEEKNRKSEFLTVYTPIIGRKCKIVNVPIIDVPKDDAQLADEADGVEISEDNANNTSATNNENTENNENINEEDNENTDTANNENTDTANNENTDTANDENTNETNPLSTNESNEEKESNQTDNAEQFNQNNLDFIKNYNDDDYIYFILISLLLTSLFFIYLRYK
jgi:hypothetical protein